MLAGGVGFVTRRKHFEKTANTNYSYAYLKTNTFPYRIGGVRDSFNPTSQTFGLSAPL
jgi:hypothetical protein